MTGDDGALPETSPVTLATCDDEPIHVPGRIQNFGYLIAFDPITFAISRQSCNCRDLGAGVGDWSAIGRPLDAVVGASAAHSIRNALARASDPARAGLVFGLVTDFGTFDVCAHHHGSEIVIELLPASQSDLASIEMARIVMRRLGQLSTLDALAKAAPRLIKAAFNYDRVMIYRFSPDGSGQVIGEAKREKLESFQGQWFPASDIPAQARALYVKNTVRVIGDAHGTPIEVEPQLGDGGAPLDLSFAFLRAVSPIHCEYLRNMGVAASMSISILVDGELWGLIACHHYAPRFLCLAERVNAEILGEYLSLQVASLLHRDALAAADAARRSLNETMQSLAANGSGLEALPIQIDQLRSVIPSDGAAMWIRRRDTVSDLAPAPKVLRKLAEIAKREAPGRVWSTSELATHSAFATVDLAGVAGVLAIPLSQTSSDCLFFFRREVERTVDWAGDPNKEYATGPNGDRLTPRASFAIWKELVRGQSDPWTVHDLEAAEALRVGIIEVIVRQHELLGAARRQADARLERLNGELNHRIKNILELIRSLIRQSRTEGRSLADYVDALEGRVLALSLAHDQVLQDTSDMGIAALVAAEVAPYQSERIEIVTRGPPLAFTGRAHSVMALVIHELATNAAKYGSLSAGSGRLEVAWSLTAAGDCRLIWTESGGPAVVEPSRRGFGSTLIERSIPFDLDGEAHIDFAGEGLRARFQIPARHVVRMRRTAPEKAPPATPKAPVPAHLLDGKRVLVVEDQFVIALEAEHLLSDLGVGAVETATSVAEAMLKIERSMPDVAILDVNLGDGRTSVPIAEALARLRIPFVFATGYGDSAMLPPALFGLPIVRKPYSSRALASALASALDAAAAPP